VYSTGRHRDVAPNWWSPYRTRKSCVTCSPTTSPKSWPRRRTLVPWPVRTTAKALSRNGFTSDSVDKRDASAAAAAPGCANAAVTARESDSDTATAVADWFADFLIDRAPHKPSEHTMKAYRQDFAAVADLLTAGRPRDIALADIPYSLSSAPPGWAAGVLRLRRASLRVLLRRHGL